MGENLLSKVHEKDEASTEMIASFSRGRNCSGGRRRRATEEKEEIYLASSLSLLLFPCKAPPSPPISLPAATQARTKQASPRGR